MTTRSIAIVTDEPGWHGARLRRAFALRGWQVRYVSLAQCRIDLDSSPPSPMLEGFGFRLPQGVFVRGVAGGTLEQVVLRLDVLHALRELGVPVYNDARAIERSVDKGMTSFLLKLAGIATPATWVTESEAHARAVAMREIAAGRELVIKPLFGSQGVGLKRIRAVSDLPPAAEYRGVFYLQRYIDCGEGNWHDFRVFVIGGQVAGAMIRRGSGWINNVAQGGRCQAIEADSEMASLAVSAVAALDLDYGGVDMMRDTDGRLMVVEVNGIPAWRGLQSVTKENVAQWLADDMLTRRLRARTLEAVC